ncbi:MAG: lysophospholipid acyltransferase family protein [Pseudomonadota bacterium]
MADGEGDAEARPPVKAGKPTPPRAVTPAQILASLLFDAWFYLSMAVMGVVLAPLALASRDGAYWSVKMFCRQALWVLRLLCGVRIEIRGEMPVGGALIAAKHQSFLDVLILVMSLPRATFVMKRSLIYTPFVGFYAWRLGAAPIDRGSGSAAVRAMRKRLSELGEENRQVIIYPQGTRLPPGAVAPYRPGVALLYAGTAHGCAPVATNTGLFWGRRSIVKRPGVAVVSFLEPIAPGLKRPAFMELLEQRIETASDQLMREGEAAARHGRLSDG